MPANTTYRHMSINALLPRWWHLGGHTWKTRLPLLGHVIRVQNPDFVSVQEVDINTALDIAKQLGSAWGYDRHENNAVYWRRDKWDQEVIRKWNLSGKQVRTLILIKLRHKVTKAYVWIGSTHLSVKATNLTQAAAVKERRGQIADILRLTKDYKWISIGADWNDPDYSMRRTLYSQGGYKTIKAQVRPKNANIDSHHGFKPPKKNSLWIDDILNKSGVKVISAELVLTGPATDHNALVEVAEIQATKQTK